MKKIIIIIVVFFLYSCDKKTCVCNHKYEVAENLKPKNTAGLVNYAKQAEEERERLKTSVRITDKYIGPWAAEYLLKYDNHLTEEVPKHIWDKYNIGDTISIKPVGKTH